MNICIPVLEDRGLESPVSAHFGSAPLFMIIDTENSSCRSIPNQNLHHSHGMCQPLLSLAGEKLDGMVVGGIGMGALGKLMAANIRVYLAEHSTVDATLSAFKNGKLRLVTPATACGHHGRGEQDMSGQAGCHGAGGRRS
jgi:predicted Fe-Mo cluster-binding NifX family protein